MDFFNQLLIICPLLFLAGFIDSVAGGGGLLSTPAYLLTGLPIHQAMGTNKVSSSIGTTIAAARYIKNKSINWKTAIISAIFSFFGSYLGSQIALIIDANTLKSAFIFLLPFIACFVLFKKDKSIGVQKVFGTKLYIISAIIGVVIGLYDGLIGPGTGTFIIFSYTSFIGFDYITASGNAKIINLSSNIAAAFSFIIAGKVVVALAIPAAIATTLGNYFGSGFAIKHGGKVVRRMLILVLIAIFIQLIFDVLS